jgi:hypothetical protein
MISDLPLHLFLEQWDCQIFISYFLRFHNLFVEMMRSSNFLNFEMTFSLFFILWDLNNLFFIHWDLIALFFEITKSHSKSTGIKQCTNDLWSSSSFVLLYITVHNSVFCNSLIYYAWSIPTLSPNHNFGFLLQKSRYRKVFVPFARHNEPVS